MVDSERHIEKSRAGVDSLTILTVPWFPVLNSLSPLPKDQPAHAEGDSARLGNTPSLPQPAHHAEERIGQISSAWEGARDAAVQHPALRPGGFRVLGRRIF